MRDYQHPQDAAELFRFKLALVTDAFMERSMSDDVFTASLFALGFRGVRLREEFRYHDMRRHEARAKLPQALMEKARDGLDR